VRVAGATVQSNLIYVRRERIRVVEGSLLRRCGRILVVGEYRPRSRVALRGLLPYWSIIVHIPSLNIAVRPWESSWLSERRDIRNSVTKNASIHTPFNCTIPFFLACTSFVSPSLNVIFASVIESFLNSAYCNSCGRLGSQWPRSLASSPLMTLKRPSPQN